MTNCILPQTYSRFTNFAFKPSSRFTYLHAYAKKKKTSKFELCKEVNFIDEIYGLCSSVASFEYNADLKKNMLLMGIHMLHLPCRRHRPSQVNCVFNVSALPVFPAWYTSW